MSDADLLLRGHRHAKDYGHGDVLDVINDPTFDQMALRDKVDFLRRHASDPSSRLHERSWHEQMGPVISAAITGGGMGGAVGLMLGSSSPHRAQFLHEFNEEIKRHPALTDKGRFVLEQSPLTEGQAAVIARHSQPRHLRPNLTNLKALAKGVPQRFNTVTLPALSPVGTPYGAPERTPWHEIGDTVLHEIHPEVYRDAARRYLSRLGAPARNFALTGAAGSAALALMNQRKAEQARRTTNRALGDISTGKDPEAAAVSLLMSKQRLQESRNRNHSLSIKTMDSALKYGPLLLPIMSR